MTDFFHAYTLSEKYAVEIPMDQIICDEKVDHNYIHHLEEKIDEVRSIKPIVVVKHPREESYAILDGHHRFWVMKHRGVKTVRAAIVDDYFGLGFTLAISGKLQPPLKLTRYIKVPIKRFVEYIENFLVTRN